MKELTMEEKAKAYDEAKINGSRLWECGEITRANYEFIFPELKESEDERIRKAIKYGLDHVFTNNTTIYEVRKEQCLAWLEKQGEHANFLSKIQVGDMVTRNYNGELVILSQLQRVAKPCKGEQKPAKNIVETWKEMRLEVYQQASGNRHEPNCSDGTTKMFSLNDIDEIIDKISEQKPADKVEQKFKVGDWLISNNIVAKPCCITQIHEPYYYLTNENSFIQFEEEDKMHFWTIQDAKDGDVLACDTNIIIYGGYINNYAGRIGDKAILAYCGWNGEKLVINKKKKEGFGGIGYVPATKEQRALLFQKMREAGYEWDAEKKELKKLKED